MNYITLKRKPTSGVVELRIVPETHTVDHDLCEVWALRTGQQVLIAYGNLLRRMKTFYMSGNLDTGAVYVLDYEQAVMVVSAILGPSDKMRCRLLTEQGAMQEAEAVRTRNAEIEQFVEDFCGGAFRLIWVCLVGCFKVVWYCVLMVLFLRWTHKRRR